MARRVSILGIFVSISKKISSEERVKPREDTQARSDHLEQLLAVCSPHEQYQAYLKLQLLIFAAVDFVVDHLA